MGKGSGKGRAPGYWDEALAYNTIKYVRIKNACVGGLHYFFMFLILMYLLGYVFLVQKKYLHIDQPLSQIRFATMGPCQPTSPAGLCTVASPTKSIKAVGEMCRRAFQCNHHPYCAEHGENSSVLAHGKQPCVWWDHNSATWPPSESNAMTLATRTSIYQQHLKYPNGKNCGPPNGKGLAQTDWNCQWEPSVVSGKSFDAYVADVGNFTVSINQEVSATVLPIMVTGMQMRGELLRCKEGTKCDYTAIDHFETMKNFVPNKLNHGNAVLTVDEILQAVVPPSHKGIPKGAYGMDLDDVNAGCPEKCVQLSTGKHQMQSNRWTGFVIVLDLQYDNTGLLIKGSSYNDVRYRLRAYAVDQSTFRVEVPYLQRNNSRVIHHLHGIRLVTMTKGNLGQFSYNTILIQLTTSITLIFLSTTIVDLLITRCMVNKDYYNAVKYQDDDDAITSVKDEAERAELQKAFEESHKGTGLDWTAIATGGFCSGVEEKKIPKPNTGSSSGSHSSMADEATPLMSTVVDTPALESVGNNNRAPAQSGGSCGPMCRPARDRSAADQV